MLAIPAAAQQVAVPDTIAQRALACVACHGKQGRATSEGYFPRIAGKPAGYLYNQLVNFQHGRRQYPPMTYLIDHMPDAYLREIAGYFAAQHPPYPVAPPSRLPAAALERGRVLALSGDRSSKIPACSACHGAALGGVQPATPGLLGLPRDYLIAQIGAWKNGARRAAAPDCMAQVSRQLSPDDAAAVAGWLAAQPVPAGMLPAPAPAAPIRLPLACGSVPPSHGQ
nr:c-type cytochrome [Massilia soli]